MRDRSPENESSRRNNDRVGTEAYEETNRISGRPGMQHNQDIPNVVDNQEPSVRASGDYDNIGMQNGKPVDPDAKESPIGGMEGYDRPTDGHNQARGNAMIYGDQGSSNGYDYPPYAKQIGQGFADATSEERSAKVQQHARSYDGYCTGGVVGGQGFGIYDYQTKHQDPNPIIAEATTNGNASVGDHVRYGGRMNRLQQHPVMPRSHEVQGVVDDHRADYMNMFVSHKQLKSDDANLQN